MKHRDTAAGHLGKLREHIVSIVGAGGKGYAASDPREWECKHETLPLRIDVLGFENRPWSDNTTYSTLGLSTAVMRNGDGKEFPARLELLGMTANGDDRLVNVLATASFIVMRTHRLLHPGAVIEDCVKEYIPLTTTPHLLLLPPFYWHDREPLLGPVTMGGHKIVWLWTMPICEGEFEFLQEHGWEELENRFEKADFDQVDFFRDACVSL